MEHKQRLLARSQIGTRHVVSFVFLPPVVFVFSHIYVARVKAVEEVGSGTEELVQRRVKMYIFHKSTGFFFYVQLGKSLKKMFGKGRK